MKYKIIYTDRKTVSMKIENDGTLTVRAPRRTPRKELDSIVAKYSHRLEEMRKRVIKKETAIASSNEAELERRLRETVLPLVEKYSRLMGLYPKKIKFTNAKTRFGSCGSNGTICFSRYLALYPEEAIEYVVVHEIAHLDQMNHSKKFYAIVEKYLPDWKRRKAQLKIK